MIYILTKQGEASWEWQVYSLMLGSQYFVLGDEIATDRH